MLRYLLLLAAALALASCGGPISKDDCDKAREAGNWDVSFALSSGDAAKCPVLKNKVIALPGGHEENCGSTQADIIYTVAENPAVQNRCSLRFEEQCPDYQLDCRYVDVTGTNSASGDCYYKVGNLSCGYAVSWTKQ
ncbi:MAG: hypothetical protein QM765_46700 [Myxococcales bacterium]